MKTIRTTLAALLVIAGILTTSTLAPATPGGNGTVSPTPTPAPTPITVAVQSADLTLVANNVPVAVIESLRSLIIANPAFAFPGGLDGHPVKSITVIVNGNKAQARIVLGAAAN